MRSSMSVGGIPIHMVCDGKAAYESRLMIACERGSVEIERLHRPELAHVKYSDGRMLEINAPFEVDDFYGEIQHATQLIQTGKLESPVMPLAATQRCAQHYRCDSLDALGCGAGAQGELGGPCP